MKVYEETDYARESYILDKLTDHLKRNYENGKDKKVAEYYCAMFTILQSSGYGKSRLMEKLGSRIPTFYSSLRSGIGYPRASFFLQKLIQELGKAVEKGVLDKETINNASPTYNYCHMNNLSTAVYIYILRILYLILTDKKNKDQKLSRYFEIDPAITGHHLFTGLGDTDKKGRIFQMLFKDLEKVCLSDTNIIFNGQDTIKLQSSFRFDVSSEPLNLNEFKLEGWGISSYRATESGGVLLTDKLENDVMSLLKQFKQNSVYKHLPSIFVIDEAHGLLYDAKDISEAKRRKYEWKLRDINLRIIEKEKEAMKVTRSPYNIFRRVFRMYFYTWEELLFIAISTCGQISVLLPELKEDPSRRQMGSVKFMDNFALVQTYSANSHDAREISAGMFRKRNIHGIKNWKEFLESNFRKIEYFKLGRPLTYAYFKGFWEKKVNEGRYSLEANFKDCTEFSFMATKLFGGGEYTKTKNYSCLYSMFNFAFGTNYLPSFVNREDLVEKYMMTLVKNVVDHEEDTSHIVGGFFPEGVLNFLSAKYFAGNHESLFSILKSSVKYGLCNVEGFGELLAQYFLLRAIFFCIDTKLLKVRKLVFQPVPLKNFLLRLISNSDKVHKFFELNRSLDGSQVSFGYFEHYPKQYVIKPFDLMARCLFKGSAIAVNNLYPGIDLMIPLVLPDGDISFLGIQVKFVKEKYVKSQVEGALEKMKFSKLFWGCQNDRPFALMILALGKYSGFYGGSEVELFHFADQNPLEAPPVLSLKGIPRFEVDSYELFDLAPEEMHYRGVDTTFLKDCDRLFELTREIPPRPESTRVEHDSSTSSSDSEGHSSKRSKP